MALCLGKLLLFLLSILGASTADLTGGLICAAAAGRTAMVTAMYFLPYARPEGGLGQLFTAGSTTYAASLISILLLLLIVVFILIIFSAWCLKKIAGFTGDTIGCLCEIMETGILLAVGLTF